VLLPLIQRLAVVLVLVSGSLASSKIPDAMRGVWAGNVTHSPLGPQTSPTFSPQIPNAYMSITLPDKGTGMTYIRHIVENQLFMVSEEEAQYCFSYANADSAVTGADTAPFYIHEHSDTAIKFCWRGGRLPSHKANCTGCDCAMWTLTLGADGDSLVSEFQQSPPAIHMRVPLVRIPHVPPQPADGPLGRQGWNCTFQDYTGFPNRTVDYRPSPLPVTQGPPPRSSMCPFNFSRNAETAAMLPTASTIPRENGDAHKQCVLIGGATDEGLPRVRLEYQAEKLPCWPCRVDFTVTMFTPPSSGNSYIAIGFKEEYAAYYGFDKMRELVNYWGMATSPANVTELGGRMLVAYNTGSGKGCVRHMTAQDAYVGSVVDVEDDGFLFDTGVTAASYKGQKYSQMNFSAIIHAAEDEAGLHWSNRVFGEQRMMWATGSLGGSDDCSANTTVGYHDGLRGLASLNFPGYGQECP